MISAEFIIRFFALGIAVEKWYQMFKSYLIKQFVVTNCSKERPGSIVNETLKNGISMLKDISKESDFYAEFKIYNFYQI